MDVLVEMTPGSGWLAREGDRIVYLPTAETVDTAHDVIEPLLIPRNINDSFATIREWIDNKFQIPQIILISLEPSVRVVNHRIDSASFTSTPGQPSSALRRSDPAEIIELGEICSLSVDDEEEGASGMLVEGVVRAGGVRLHFHRGWGTDGPRETNTLLPNSLLEVELGTRRLAVGNGLVLGRWPYSHPDFDDTLEPLILNDPAVSRLHATVAPAERGVMLSDFGSHNGTWVERASGESVQVSPDSPQPLAPGDQVRVGDTILRIRESSE